MNGATKVHTINFYPKKNDICTRSSKKACVCHLGSKVSTVRVEQAINWFFQISANGNEQEMFARIFHESLAATTDMAVLPGVLGCRNLRRTVQVRLGTNTLRLPSGTPIFVVSRQQFMNDPG
jgi:hypothetical protein